MIPMFRAWTEEGQVMYYNVYPFANNTLLLSYDDIAYDEVPADDFILMQSTGLFDKNGVEVFVGDIVRCSQGCPHEVIFIKEFGGMFVGGMPTIYLSDMSEGYAWTGNEEVIGNIYENPELVENVNEPK